MLEQQSFHGTSLICKSLNGLLLSLSQCQLSTDSPSVQLPQTGEAAIHCFEKMYQPASYLIRFQVQDIVGSIFS